MKLDGKFGIDDGSFKSETQKDVNVLSAGARGQNKDDPETVLDDLKGEFGLARGVSTFSYLDFGVPGAHARLHGTYNIVNHRIGLHGEMRVDTQISKTSSGFKALLLKVMDPIFRKKKEGEIVPIHILGTYEKPQFGPIWARTKRNLTDIGVASPQTFLLTSASGIAVNQSSTTETRLKTLILPIVLSLMALNCGGGVGSSPVQTPMPSGQPTFAHVVMVVEENHGYSEVIGNSSMPYLNSLASQYGVATQYFANAHPSLPNYLMLTTGMMETFDDNFAGIISDDNVVHELLKAGKTWKAYQESIPSTGYLGLDAPPYLRHHNPFSYLSDVQNDPNQAANIVPFTQLATDLANNALPQFSFITPNLNNDAHDGSLAAADAWLQTNIAPLIANPTFQSSGLLIITFDEGAASDVEHGGGHIATIIVSSKSKTGFQSQTFYQHQSTLRLALAASGVTNFPGDAGVAPDMVEFFTGH